jgi:hypothetical protein
VTIPVPTFVRIEYWSPIAADWWVGHAGINLMDPEDYVTGVTDKGKMIARAVVVDTGEVIYPKGYGADLL